MRIEVEDVRGELVGADGLDVAFLENPIRNIFRIVGYDMSGIAPDGGRENAAVVLTMATPMMIIRMIVPARRDRSRQGVAFSRGLL